MTAPGPGAQASPGAQLARKIFAGGRGVGMIACQVRSNSAGQVNVPRIEGW